MLARKVIFFNVSAIRIVYVGVLFRGSFCTVGVWSLHHTAVLKYTLHP